MSLLASFYSYPKNIYFGQSEKKWRRIIIVNPLKTYNSHIPKKENESPLNFRRSTEIMTNTTRISVSTYGIILAIAGVEHGIGEMFQGNITPPSTMIQSWPDSDLYEILSGEPAMTLIPNLFITGIVAIMISLLLFLWTIKFIHTQHGSIVFFSLSVLMVLTGGGLAGPLLIGVTISLASKQINSRFEWWKEKVSIKITTILARNWKYFYFLSIFFWFSLWPGLIILGMFTKLEDPLVVIVLSLLSFSTMLLSIFAAFALDSLKDFKVLPN